MRAYQSSDGITWSECDAANAPAAANDTGSPAPGVYNYFGVVRDANPSVHKCYLLFWNTNFTIALKPFNFATQKWEATVTSTLGYLTASAPSSNQSGFSLAHRITDNSVWFAFPAGESGTGGERVFGAKCVLGTGFDAVLTRIYPAVDTDPSFYQPAGMVADSAGNLHLIVDQVAQPPAPFTNQILHLVIHTNNTITAPDTVVSNTNAVSNIIYTSISYLSISYTDLLMFQYGILAQSDSWIARGQAGDAPAWDLQNPTNAHFKGAHDTYQTVLDVSGKQYALFVWKETASPFLTHWSYISSPGITQPFDVVETDFLNGNQAPPNVGWDRRIQGVTAMLPAVGAGFLWLTSGIFPATTGNEGMGAGQFPAPPSTSKAMLPPSLPIIILPDPALQCKAGREAKRKKRIC